MLVDIKQYKEKLFLSFLRTAFFVFSFFLIVSCQTTAKQLTLSSATYVPIPVYNERTHNRFAFTPKIEMPEQGQEMQLIALPSQKPSQVFLSADDIRLNPSVLVGYSVKLLDQYFGEPSTKRKDGASTIYQYYVSSDCVLDVFAYHEALDVKLGQEDLSGIYFVDEDIRKGSVIEYTDLRALKGTERSCMNKILGKKAVRI